MIYSKYSVCSLKQFLFLLSRKNEPLINISVSNGNQIYTQRFLSCSTNYLISNKNKNKTILNTVPILTENGSRILTHKQFFHAKKKKAKTKEIETNKNIEEDGDEQSDKLVFLNDDMSDEETIDVPKNNILQDRKANLSDRKNQIEQNSNQSSERKKKSIYDADHITIYDDILDLPDNLLSQPLTNEEIEHVNSGGADLNLGSYQNTIVFITKVKKEKTDK